MKINKLIGIWLLTGVVMIYIQVIIGGITRLTGSGLSITRWEIITGVLPPLNNEQWLHEFELYRKSPQYLQINKGMQLSEFKMIYFWEYIHRLWARLIGFAFIFPMAWFVFRKQLSPKIIKKLFFAFSLGLLVAVFGWIMVKSGLNDRPMVSPYKLAVHLTLAVITLCYVLWLTLGQFISQNNRFNNLVNNNNIKLLKNFLIIITVITSFQIVAGAVLSGMRGALFYPTWPLMNGVFIPVVLTDFNSWNTDAFINFEKYPHGVALTQFLHRITGYIIFILVIITAIYGYLLTSGVKRMAFIILPLFVILQTALGIFILINSKGNIPVLLAVIHQAVAILLLMWLMWMLFLFKKNTKIKCDIKNYTYTLQQ